MTPGKRKALDVPVPDARERPLLRLGEVCEILRVSRSTLNQMLAEGTIPTRMVRRTRYVATTDLRAFVRLPPEPE
jgi:excisionase family DNA binding protein